MLGDREFSNSSVNHRHFKTETFAPFAIFAFRNASTRDTFPNPTINTAPTPITISNKKTTSPLLHLAMIDLERSTHRAWPQLQTSAISINHCAMRFSPHIFEPSFHGSSPSAFYLSPAHFLPIDRLGPMLSLGSTAPVAGAV